MPQTLPSVVLTVGEEIARMGTIASELQDYLGELVSGSDITGMVAVQSIDALTQGLEGLAAFVQELATGLPLECRPDLAAALGMVSLSSLARRLAQDPAQCSDAELELFA